MIDPRRPNFADTPASELRPRFAYAPAPGALSSVPACTVITPFYNVGPEFAETAACLLGDGDRAGQSLQNFEWVIVNDGSTSAESLAMLAEYRPGGQKHDPRVRVVDLAENRGLPAARNTGFREARSGFVFQLDGDDLIEPTTLEKCLWFLHSQPQMAFVKGLTVGFGSQEYLWDRGFHEYERFRDQNMVTATAMVRASVHRLVGGYDESQRGGMEDWEFWLRCASRGEWGATIPEYLDWYRRRDRRAGEWEDLLNTERREAFVRKLRERYTKLYEQPFPNLGWRKPQPYEAMPDRPYFENPLAKRRPRLMLVVPWLQLGGADRFNKDVLEFVAERLPVLVRERRERGDGLPAMLGEGSFSGRGGIGGACEGGEADGGWEVTVVTNLRGHPWLPEFSRHTPDVFCLDHFACPSEHPLAVRHLIESRRPDVVMIANSELGYLSLPYLRAHCPQPVYVDYNHMEETHWRNGGHARTSVGYREQLDLTIVSSGHLRRWMVGRGADEERIEVCHTNGDSQRWKPCAESRAAMRAHYGLPADGPLVLYAARLCEQKQPQVFAKVMRDAVKGKGGEPTLTAVVAGDGELRGELERLLDEYGLRDNVRMLGPVTAAQMPALMAACDVFFLPSLWEGIALSIYEAMASGLAVLGADVGGQAELVTPETGVLLPRPEGEEEEVAQYVGELLALVRDHERRMRLGAAARQRIVESFVLDNMGLRMLELFEKAAEWRRRRPRVELPVGLATELAVQGVETLRINELLNQLWSFRERVKELEARRSREAYEAHCRAERELAELEGSRAWRLVQSIKKLPPYQLIAQVRFGNDWLDHLPPASDPAGRLAHIRSSRAYRVICGVKAMPLYPWGKGK